MARINRGTNIWRFRRMASKKTSLALDKPFTDFARRKEESGSFGSTSEVVRKAMRRYLAGDAKIEALRRDIQKGLDSRPPQCFDFDESLKVMRANYKCAA